MKLFGLGVPLGWAKPVPVKLLRPAESEARHALGRGRGTGGEPPHGDRLGRAPERAPVPSENAVTTFVGAMSVAGLQVNIVLMVLNLLPIPPSTEAGWR